jgi:hypothetical protein
LFSVVICVHGVTGMYISGMGGDEEWMHAYW